MKRHYLKNVTQSQIAKLIHTSQNSVSKVVRGLHSRAFDTGCLKLFDHMYKNKRFIGAKHYKYSFLGKYGQLCKKIKALEIQNEYLKKHQSLWSKIFGDDR